MIDFQYIIRITSIIFLMKKTNATTKSSELNSVLSSHFQGKINLARINPHYSSALEF